jgi:hypothetical protein
MNIRFSMAIAAFLALTCLSGCYEPVGVTWYEAGEYSGAHDPLLDRNIADRQETLASRFRAVQTDR